MPLGIDPGEFGRLFALSQIGLEMVVPIVVGAVLDYYFAWGPWGVIIGAVLGFLTGILRIVRYLHQQDEANRQEKAK